MKILHVIASNQRRGAESFARDLIRAFTTERLDQSVVVIREVPDGLTYDAAVTSLTSRGRVLPGLHTDPHRLTALGREISRERPDVIQAHGGEAFKYLAVLPKPIPPVVYRKIGMAPPWIRRGPRRIVHSLLMRRSRAMVAAAEAVRREAIDLFGYPADRIETIPRAVDATRLAPDKGRSRTRSSLNIDARTFVVLSLGAFTWEKDPLTHVKITRPLLRGHREVVHLMAGDGPLMTEVARFITAEALDDRVVLLGNRPDVADLLDACDVLLLASRSEGMPGCLIEAGIAGRPSVAFSLSGVPDVIDPSRTGLLAAPGDTETMSKHLETLLFDPKLRSRMGVAARRLCLDRFDIQPVARRFVGLYERLKKVG